VSKAEKAALLALAKAAEAALIESERARLERDVLEYTKARRQCALFLERLILRLQGMDEPRKDR
jgi:hypothetical protein